MTDLLPNVRQRAFINLMLGFGYRVWGVEDFSFREQEGNQVRICVCMLVGL